MNKKCLLLLWQLSCVFFLFSQPNVRQIWLTDQLSHTFSAPDWQFRKVGEKEWLPAKAPSTVHSDLLANGKIEAPFLGENEKKLQWIGETDWEYQTTFELESFDIQANHIELVCEGLDTYSQVWINGQAVFTTENMFHSYQKEVKKLLKEGENTLHIRFFNAIDSTQKLSKKYAHPLPEGENGRVFVRKAAYHFGWDWGPKFVTCGVWKPIYLRLWNDLKISELQVIQSQLDTAKATLKIQATIQSEFTNEKCYFLSSDDEGNEWLDSLILQKGENQFTTQFTMLKPKLWWTNGLGEPHLYKMLFRLVKSGKLVDLKKVDLGLRTIEIVQEKDEKGKSFYVKLNGVPIFMKGANVIPFNSFLPKVSAEKYDSVLSSAKKANMNMLRVWGGGIYEDDYFYQLCDKYGILIWQDFMFACAMYPFDNQFLNNVETEATYQVKRLRNHPCIALWCGNNEIDEGWHNWGWQKKYAFSKKDSSEIWKGYQTLFHQVLPKIVQTHDAQRYYHPSSPTFGWGRKQSLTEGDAHYWGVWWGLQPFSIFNEKVGRFMSEYGMQAMPDIKTVYSFTKPEERTLFSPAIKHHQKHPTGFTNLGVYLKRDYRKAKDLEDYVYKTQLLQSEGIKIAIEAHRRNKPYCMGTLYWQLNDCWQVCSWSSLDYFNRPKALHYTVQNLYKTHLLSFYEEDNSLKVKVITDSLANFRAVLSITTMNFEGQIISQTDKTIEISANSAKAYSFFIPVQKEVPAFYQKTTLRLATLSIDNQVLAKNIHYYAAPKDLKLPKPTFTQKIIEPTFSLLESEGEKRYIIEIQADKLVKNLYLYAENEDIEVENNYQDLLPNEKRKCYVKNKDTVLKMKYLNP
ncbi:MAG: glycoside hydrolase family 2 protein [Bacteroidia bacterium]